MKNYTVIIRTEAELAQMNSAELRLRIIKNMATIADYTSVTPVIDLLWQDMADLMALQGQPVVTPRQKSKLLNGICETWRNTVKSQLTFDFKAGQIVAKKPEAATKAETKSTWVVEEDRGDHLVVKAIKGPKKDCYGFWNKDEVQS